MSQLINAPPLPVLTPLDGSLNRAPIEFQFQPLDSSEDVGAAWASATGMNRDHPILQYSHGEQRGFNFSARLFAKDSEHTIDEVLALLKQATERDPELKRPPRFNFSWGSVINETVVVKSVGGIKYDSLRNDGSLRGATLQIQLLVYRFIDVELSGKPEPSTFYGITKTGDQWEDIALREYGDPLMGELLRRINPAVIFPGQQPGSIVRLPPASKLRGESIEPDSPPMRRTPEGMALRLKMFELRSKSRESTVLLR